jgi:DNA-binding CsgD family transcriptional regulator
VEQQTPELEDVRSIYRMIHEVCELGADAHGWRAHFQSRLISMIDATMANGYVMRLALKPAAIKPDVELMVLTGTNDAWKQYLARGDLTDNPQTPHIMARFGTDFTCTRQALVDDATWYGSEFYERVCVPSGWDHHIHSQVCIDPPGVINGCGICRPVGAPPFGTREVAIVHFAHQELAHLWRKPDPLGVNALSKRLRQTLHCIRQGLGRKQIAQQLGLSVHTAHAYEKTLFGKYAVTSRPELMALLGSSIRPALLPLEQDNDSFEEPAMAQPRAGQGEIG